MANRKRWYNPMLDPRTQTLKMTEAMRKAVEDQAYADNAGPLNEPDAQHPYNLVSSLCDDGMHRPALDIDVPCRVVPSSTEGHCHIYFDTLALSWPQYLGLLGALTAAGIIDVAYLAASIKREQTLLRPEHVRKGQLVA